MSLLDTEQTTATTNDSTTTATTAGGTQTTTQLVDQAAWLIDDNIPGTGNRPDWLPEKFKSVAELAKSYGDIEKLNSKTYGAPEQYQLAEQFKDVVSEDGYGLLTKVAKELNFSQATFDGIVNSVITAEKAKAEQIAQAQQQALNEMRTAIGNERLTSVSNFINSVGLGDKQLQAIKSAVSSVEAFEAMEALMKKVTTATNQSQPPANTGNNMSLSDVNSKINDILRNPEYKRNPSKYHEELRGLYQMQGKL